MWKKWTALLLGLMCFAAPALAEVYEGSTVAQRFLGRQILLACMAGIQAVVCCVGCLILGIQVASLPLFILTAYDWTDIETEARKAGVTAFCPKPFFMSEFRSVMEASFRPEKPAEALPEKVDFSGKRVLLVEDNEMNQMIAEAILTDAGFQVDIAGDGEVAVDRMSAEPAGHYDIVLMDIQMPKMDGYEATRRIRALADPRKARIPIVAVTANVFVEDVQVALDAGMDAHLPKPLDVPMLVDVLGELLDGRGAAREAVGEGHPGPQDASRGAAGSSVVASDEASRTRPAPYWQRTMRKSISSRLEASSLPTAAKSASASGKR